MSDAVCIRCAEPQLTPPVDELCVWCREETVAVLAGTSPESTRAVWRLRDAGYSAEAVLTARHEVRQGIPVEEVARSLEATLEPSDAETAAAA